MLKEQPKIILILLAVKKEITAYITDEAKVISMISYI